MAEQNIICPYCKKEIPLTQAITQKIEAHQIPRTRYLIMDGHNCL